MAFIAVYIYAGVGGEWVGLRRSVDHFYEQTNLADVFLYGSDFTEAAQEAVLETEGITDTERRLDLIGVAELDGNPKISLHFVENNNISSLYLVGGAGFDSNDAEGVWLDKRFADARGLSPDDRITLSYNGYEFTKTIRGLIYGGEYVFRTDGDSVTPDFYANGYAYLSDSAFPFPDMMTYNVMLIKTDSADMYALEESISEALGGAYSIFLPRENHASVDTFYNEIIQHKMLGDVFPVVFALVALLIIITTMTRILSAQRTQIGTLKALGFKKKSIVRHYMAYGFWLTFPGAVLGVVLGPQTLPYLFYPSMSGFYTLPEWKPAYDVSFFIMAAVIVLICTMAVYSVSRKLLGDTHAATLRPKAPKAARHSVLERTALWRGLNFNARWNIRDTSRNKARSAMAVIGVLGCGMLLICAFGINDSSNDMKVWQYERLYQFETKLNISDTATNEEILHVVKAVSGEPLMESIVEVKANGVKKSGALTVTDNENTLLAFTDSDLGYINLPPDGISLTEKLARSLGVSVGDMIEWHVYGDEKWTVSRLEFINREPTVQGITMTRTHFENLGYSFKATSILSAQRVSEEYDGIASVMSTSDIVAGWDDLTKQMMLLTYILIGAASLLSIVVLYNLGLLAFTEMEREMATLKVIGMKSRKLGRLLLTQNIWFSALGFALGAPAGLWLIDKICQSSGESFDFPVNLHTTNLLMSFCITFCLYVAVNLFFSRRIKTLSMVEALKSIE